MVVGRNDIGVETTIRIIEKLEERVERDKYINTSELNNFLAEEISLIMVVVFSLTI